MLLYILFRRKTTELDYGLCNNYLEGGGGGVGKPERGDRGKSHIERGGVGWKI